MPHTAKELKLLKALENIEMVAAKNAGPGLVDIRITAWKAIQEVKENMGNEMQNEYQLPKSFEWHLNVSIDSAQVEIEVQYEAVDVEVGNFDADTSITVDEDLLDECLDMDDLLTLKRICEAVIEKRNNNGGE